MAPVSEGASLYAVGKLLGHTRHQTTQRYAHLAPQALQETTERLGKAYSPDAPVNFPISCVLRPANSMDFFACALCSC